VCLSVYLSAAACPHYYTNPDVTWGSGRGCPLVVHYLADLKSVHGLCCYGNITRTRNVSECMLVLALCLVAIVHLVQMATKPQCKLSDLGCKSAGRLLPSTSMSLPFIIVIHYES